MHVLLYFLSFLAVIATAISSSDFSNDTDWSEFVKKNNKKYKNSSETDKRYQNWKKRNQQVRLHNSKKHNYTKKIYFFADWTDEEIRSRLNGFKLSKFRRNNVTTQKPSITSRLFTTTTRPLTTTTTTQTQTTTITRTTVTSTLEQKLPTSIGNKK
jgi:hypothetical protein